MTKTVTREQYLQSLRNCEHLKTQRDRAQMKSTLHTDVRNEIIAYCDEQLKMEGLLQRVYELESKEDSLLRKKLAEIV